MLENDKGCLLSWTQVMLLPSAVTRTVLSHLGYYSVVGWKSYFGIFCYSCGKCLYFDVCCLPGYMRVFSKMTECRVSVLQDVNERYNDTFLSFRVSSPKIHQDTVFSFLALAVLSTLKCMKQTSEKLNSMSFQSQCFWSSG